MTFSLSRRVSSRGVPIVRVGDMPYCIPMTDDAFFAGTTAADRDWWQALWPDPAAVLDRLGIGPGLTVVDLCCGDGYFTAPMSRIIGPAGRIFAVDLLPDMLARAKAHVAAEGCDNVTWIEADARRLADVIPAAVDGVVMTNTLHGVPDKTGLARAVAGVLRPGGFFAVVNWHAARSKDETPVLGKPRGPDPALRLSPEATAAAIGPAGFVSARLEDVGPYHDGTVFRKAGN